MDRGAVAELSESGALCLSYPICKMELILAPKSWCRYEDLQDAPAPHAEALLRSNAGALQKAEFGGGTCL